MAVVLKEYQGDSGDGDSLGEMVEVGAVVDREFYGPEQLANLMSSFNLDFDGVEDALVDEFDSHALTAIKVDDDEVDIDAFRR
jgi:hypothetical protein